MTRTPQTVRTARALAVAAALALTLAACGTSEGPTAGSGGGSAAASDATGTSDSGSATGADVSGGAYLTRAEYEADPAAHEGTAVVYFFHAPWCPSCRATEEAIGESGVPDGLTLVKVDFDSETALRQEYGVTTQHTFVQVGPDGAALKTWTGSSDGAAILAETV